MRNDPRSAIREHEIVCLVCGRALRQLTNTHLRSHGLSTEAYREAFGYNRGTALMAQALWTLYRDRAVRVRLADRIRENPLRRDPGLSAQGGLRTIRLEERLNRQEVGRRAARLREARYREADSTPRRSRSTSASCMPSAWRASRSARSPAGSGFPP